LSFAIVVAFASAVVAFVFLVVAFASIAVAFAIVVAFAFLVVIPEGNLLLSRSLAPFHFGKTSKYFSKSWHVFQR
jgi:hypothetical protein